LSHLLGDICGILSKISVMVWAMVFLTVVQFTSILIMHTLEQLKIKFHLQQAW